MMRKGKWTEAETEFLLNNYSRLTPKDCARMLDRVVHSIYRKALDLGLRREFPYTEEELEYIKAEYSVKGPFALAKEMGRPKYAIKCMAVRLGLSVSPERRSKVAREAKASWTDESHKTHSEKLRQNRGPLSPSWKGGRCNVSEIVRGRLYLPWIKPIFERDDYTCALCNERGGKLVVHHLNPFSKLRDLVIEECPGVNFDVYEDLDMLADLIIDAHTLEDGITLCHACHKKHHSENGVNCGNIFINKDNPQPSASNVIKFVGAKVQRLVTEDTQADKVTTSALAPKSHGSMR